MFLKSQDITPVLIAYSFAILDISFMKIDKLLSPNKLSRYILTLSIYMIISLIKYDIAKNI